MTPSFVWGGAFVAFSIIVVRWYRKKNNCVPAVSAQIWNQPGLPSIVALMELEDHVPIGDVKDILMQKLCIHEEFTSRIQNFNWGWPRYVAKSDFSIDHHVREGPLLKSQSQLEDFVSQHQNTPIQDIVGHDSPAWYCYVCKHQRGSSDNSDNLVSSASLVLRLDHTLADGMSLIRTIFEMDKKTPQKDLFSQVLIPKKKESAASLAGRVKGIAAMIHRIIVDVFALVTMLPDTKSALKSTKDCEKTKMRWTRDGMDLADIKKVARAHGRSTVNDVLTSALNLAFAKQLRRKGHTQEFLESARLTTVIWVNLRNPRALFKPDAKVDCGNCIGTVVMPMLLGPRTMKELLPQVTEQMNYLKKSAQPVMSKVLFAVLGFVPKALMNVTSHALMDKPTVSFSNVPGPQGAIHFLTSKVVSLQAFTRPTMSISNFIVVVSYNGKVRMGLCTDESTIEDPKVVLDDAVAEIEKALSCLD